jgi:signal transduction histidine kinase
LRTQAAALQPDVVNRLDAEHADELDELAKQVGPPTAEGIRLSIVRHAVAAMSGTVELASTPGQGTCLTVTIPHGAE